MEIEINFIRILASCYVLILLKLVAITTVFNKLVHQVLI